MQRTPRMTLHPLRSLFPWIGLALCLVLSWAHLASEEPVRKLDDVPFGLPLLWPEEQRAFLQDGPGLLLGVNQLNDLLDLDLIGREEMIVRYLAEDPDPSTPENELQEGIRRRVALVQQEFSSFYDHRARLLFLHGQPEERHLVDCAETFKPLELWKYPDSPFPLVLYREKPGEYYKLWLPIDSKRRLYNPEMEYWLDQWEELRGRISGGKRFDRTICEDSERVDLATGVDGLFGFLTGRPKNEGLKVFLEPPDDLAAWAKRAAATPEVETKGSLEGIEMEVHFPEKQGLRMTTQAVIRLPADTEVEIFEEGDNREIRLRVEGLLERDGKIFETFRMRFQLPAPEEDSEKPYALLVNRRLRPDQEFLMRLAVIEEVSQKRTLLTHGFVVPKVATKVETPAVPDEAIVAIGEELGRQRVAGYDSLVLVPPADDVIFGLWRAEALVTGDRIEKVTFSLDGSAQLSRRRPPFTAELRLATYPKEQVVKAEGFDENGDLVASDEIVINQPRGELRVQILEPPRGTPVVAGDVIVKAEVVVPEEMFVTALRFSLNEEEQAVVSKPPWEAVVTVPATGELTYLTVAAELNDGTTAEAVRFFNSPDYIEEVDVNLVELFTTVTERNGRLVRGLEASDFEIWEDGRPQEVAKFELVDDLPLNLGVTIDISGSMFESLGEAQRAATDFLESIITPRDRCFAVAFSDRPSLLMPRTSDVGAVAEALQSLTANGPTALHDAIVTSLYYYRGIRGRRALILLSDGEDTSSTLGFAETLEYAKRSGVSVFAIGLRIGRSDIGIRRKLEKLAEETGGRTFFINQASELFETYEEIEAELRSQYLVAYSSDQEGGEGEYREVEVKVKGGKLKARTLRGYYS